MIGEHLEQIDKNNENSMYYFLNRRYNFSDQFDYWRAWRASNNNILLYDSGTLFESGDILFTKGKR